MAACSLHSEKLVLATSGITALALFFSLVYFLESMTSAHNVVLVAAVLSVFAATYGLVAAVLAAVQLQPFAFRHCKEEAGKVIGTIAKCITCTSYEFKSTYNLLNFFTTHWPLRMISLQWY